MASEITYAEVKFKNESPTPVVKGLPEKKKPEQHPQKYPLWLPWLISLLLLLVCIALVVVLLVVVPFSHSSDQPSALQQQFSKWECDSAVPQGTERGWTCCPKGWRRFQRSCYFLSLDRMNCAESAQNCTGMGSQLVVITSKAEQEFLYKQKTPSTKRDNIYIGLLKDTVGQWQWVDKTPYNGTPTFWRKYEPSPGHENCTVMHVPEGNLNNWNNVNPDTMHHRICEIAAVIV
ncbi:C-type lectin domain family 4 member A [Taeniopygia guttata]|uniref:C-type lectin domain family 4 member A n=1 Tax=Taeniopygia guttata TaxID=59729 RepID=UPI003BB95FFA